MDTKMLKTHEITAVLLTQLVQRARRGRAPEPASARVEGLNLGVGAHEWETITAAARQLAGSGYDTTLPGPEKPEKKSHARRNNQTPDTPAENTTKPQIQNDVD